MFGTGDSGLGFWICSNLLWDIAQGTLGVFFFFQRGHKATPAAGALGRAARGVYSPAERAGLSKAEVLSRLHQHPPVPMPLHATQAQRLGFIWGFTAGGFHQCMRLTEGF